MYSPPPHATRTGRRALLAAILAFLCAGFAGLGFWQLERGRWKEAFLADWQRALAAPPRPLAQALGDASTAVVRVSGRGRYDEQATVLLDNQRVGAEVGVMVYTLLREIDTRRGVLVNRGFVPLGADRRLPPLDAPPTGEVAIAGLLRPAPSVGLALGDAQFVRGASPPLLTHLDHAALDAAMGGALDPRVLVPEETARDWSALPNTMPPERHRGYALQWFALAAASVVIALILLFKKTVP